MLTRSVRSQTAVAIMLVGIVQGAAAADNEVISGRVVRVLGGDSLVVVTGERETMRVELADVATPEVSQPFGFRAKEALTDLCFNQPAKIQPVGSHRGRVVAYVICGNTAVNQTLLARGYGWAGQRTAITHPFNDLEASARNSQRGLWADPAPVPPWQWRRFQVMKADLAKAN